MLFFMHTYFMDGPLNSLKDITKGRTQKFPKNVKIVETSQPA
jgi:hypothetical protein